MLCVCVCVVNLFSFGIFKKFICSFASGDDAESCRTDYVLYTATMKDEGESFVQSTKHIYKFDMFAVSEYRVLWLLAFFWGPWKGDELKI